VFRQAAWLNFLIAFSLIIEGVGILTMVATDSLINWLVVGIIFFSKKTFLCFHRLTCMEWWETKWDDNQFFQVARALFSTVLAGMEKWGCWHVFGYVSRIGRMWIGKIG
jgi:flagellar biosynthesis protein FlhB